MCSFSRLRKACLAAAIPAISYISLKSSSIARNTSRSPLRLLRQARGLKLTSKGCFRLICTDCPYGQILAILRLTPDIGVNTRPSCCWTMVVDCAAMRPSASHHFSILCCVVIPYSVRNLRTHHPYRSSLIDT